MPLPTNVLTVTVTDQTGDAIALAIVQAYLTKQEIYSGVLVPEVQWTRANASGVATLDLFPNTLGSNNSQYRITARDPADGRWLVDVNITMPATDSTLAGLLAAPYQDGGVIAWSAVADAVAAKDEAEHWANNAEDVLVAEGDLVDDYSALHHAAKASASATAASTSETNAGTSATNAATSAANAAADAAAADADRVAAETAKTAAELAETHAELAETNAEAALDTFQGIFLGAQASDPSLDLNGNALVAGDWYYNTISGVPRIYNGTAFEDMGVSSINALMQANNLSDLASAATARTNLDVYSKAEAGAQFLDAASNLSDLASVTTARTNLVLGTAAVENTGKTIGDIPVYETDGAANPVIDHPNMPLVSGDPIVERGSNANGEYVRFADGTQICSVGPVATTYTNPSNLSYGWTFPASFIVIPRCTAQCSWDAYTGTFLSKFMDAYSRNATTAGCAVGFTSNAAWVSGDEALGDNVIGFAIGKWK